MIMLDHLCDIARNQAVGTNGRKQMSVVYTATPCLVVPMSRKSTIDYNISVGQGFYAYFNDGTDVQVGDQLTSDSQVFYVQGKSSYSGLNAPVDHIECVVSTEAPNGQ